LFLLALGKFSFCAFSFLAGALQRGPLPVLAFLLLPDALALLLLAGVFLFGARAVCGFLLGFSQLLRRALALGDALLPGRSPLLLPHGALLLLAAAFRGGSPLSLESFGPLAFEPGGSFLFPSGALLLGTLAFFVGGTLLLRITLALGDQFLLGSPLLLNPMRLLWFTCDGDAIARCAAVAGIWTCDGIRCRNARQRCRFELRICIRQALCRPARRC
jgi:hypothetical protein